MFLICIKQSPSSNNSLVSVLILLLVSLLSLHDCIFFWNKHVVANIHIQILFDLFDFQPFFSFFLHVTSLVFTWYLHVNKRPEKFKARFYHKFLGRMSRFFVSPTSPCEKWTCWCKKTWSLQSTTITSKTYDCLFLLLQWRVSFK